MDILKENCEQAVNEWCNFVVNRRSFFADVFFVVQGQD
jgi:hypothetical protein